MFRRSSRLLSGGYYNSDEESDSSTVTNISYRENIVKVFKKKPSVRKPASRASSRTPSNASTATTETTAYPVDPVLSPLATASQPTMKVMAYSSTIATPRPPLSTSSSRSQTPARSVSVPREKVSLVTSVPYNDSKHKDLRHNFVESSGYSSCEGFSKKCPNTGNNNNRGPRRPTAPKAAYRGRLSSALVSLADSATLMVADAHTKMHHVKSLANNSVGSQMKKTGARSVLCLFALLGVWLLSPLFSSFYSHMTVPTIQSQINPTSQSAVSSPESIIIPPVVDPALVSAAVEEKMQDLLPQLLLKQEQFFSQLRASQRLDLQTLKDDFDAVNSDDRHYLEQQVAGLVRQIADYQTDSRSTAASLNLKIRTLETQNEKLSKEFSSMQSSPPPPPPSPILNNLTPELQEAMEKWLSDRIKEHDMVRRSDTEGCTKCGGPMADKMADFALESQGASVVSTRCSETYRFRTACVTLFGFPLWYPSVSPRTVIQGYPVLLPGKCWAFHGSQGTLVLSLSHPITISHVTVDHLPRYNSPTGSIDSAPKNFEVYGMDNEMDEGNLLGKFVYDHNGQSTQTFNISDPNNEVYRYVELRVLSNWGHMRYTCLYRFRVHGKIPT